ncbi:hypothetical protein A4G85_07485 [Burkholderia pseudomallei]|nr:hypothetical protein A4G85_07485 [Burkholderia pseudomallei]
MFNSFRIAGVSKSRANFFNPCDYRVCRRVTAEDIAKHDTLLIDFCIFFIGELDRPRKIAINLKRNTKNFERLRTVDAICIGCLPIQELGFLTRVETYFVDLVL